MKRTLAFLIFTIFFLSTLPIAAYDLYANANQVYLDNNLISFNVPLVTLNNRTLVPMRKLFEALGATVQWKEETRSVVAKKDQDVLILTIDSSTAIVNNEPIPLDAPAILYNSNTMVPLRFVSEQFNLKVEFVEEAKKILISNSYDLYSIEELKKQNNYQEIDYIDFVYYGGTKNNKPHGLGKIIDKNGIVLFKGNYTNNTWDGFGALYYSDGTLQYVGDFKDNNYNGKGISYYKNGSIFIDGTFENGKANGFCKIYCEDGSLGYEGECKNDLPFGRGTHFYVNGNKMYEGFFDENGLLDGEGTEYYENGNIRYRGTFSDGVYHGSGTIYSESGKRIGTYKYNKGKQGERLIEFALEEDGKTAKQYQFGDFIYIGEVNENEIPDGYGMYYYKTLDYLWYLGDCVNGTIEGYGKNFYENGVLFYEGDWKDGFWNGYGLEYYNTGVLAYEGQFVDNVKNGFGYFYDTSGNLLYKGDWLNGKMHGYGFLYNARGDIIYMGNFIDGSPVSSNGGYTSNKIPDISPIKAAKKLYLYANDGTGTFLGNINLNKYDVDSIANTYGNYGSKYSQTSIFNTYGTYGGKYSNYSAFNEYATKPPKILNEDGKFIGYLTANKYLQNAYSYEEVLSILR